MVDDNDLEGHRRFVYAIGWGIIEFPPHSVIYASTPPGTEELQRRHRLIRRVMLYLKSAGWGMIYLGIGEYRITHKYHLHEDFSGRLPEVCRHIMAFEQLPGYEHNPTT